ncbi:MAG: 3-hydroxyacyl-CoA dehydrogenase NAD-binding domain-containing protein [Planctomycetota bacterium]|jgi:3-hydroxybutyryl-CoA dehydrogenase|nr:3-hydroxybutyryl-CoA dehydrogenase [Planctomycetota bacterium]MDG2309281.1 3-hydroxyacyl-CoA dehydrogenase NAD-binding domain-containing protein [Planctomycetota bacterium]
MTSSLKVAVIGAGTMGNGIAQTYAANGHNVTLVDMSQEGLDRGLAAIRKSLDRFVKKEKITQEQSDEIMARVAGSTDLPTAVADVDMVVEAVFEREDVKKDVFVQLDKHAPQGAILATNTSSISITAIASATSRPESVVGMHFMNPVPLMKLVELIKGEKTSDEVVSRTKEIAEGLGKTVGVAEDYAGFISNRVLMPMINEAAFTLYEGVATRDDIDTIMKLGMNHPMGPLALADFIGIDVCVNILDYMRDQFGDPKFRCAPNMRRMVEAGKLGRKSGEGFYTY